MDFGDFQLRTASVAMKVDAQRLLWELARCASSSVNSDWIGGKLSSICSSNALVGVRFVHFSVTSFPG